MRAIYFLYIQTFFTNVWCLNPFMPRETMAPILSCIVLWSTKDTSFLTIYVHVHWLTYTRMCVCVCYVHNAHCLYSLSSVILFHRSHSTVYWLHYVLYGLSSLLFLLPWQVSYSEYSKYSHHMHVWDRKLVTLDVYY